MSDRTDTRAAPLRRKVKEVFAKGAPAPAKMALPLSLFLMPPVLAAQEATATGDDSRDLPVVFTAPPPGVEVSDATVNQLRTLTAIARLQRVAALEPELDALKYEDPAAALMKLGIELPPDVKVTIARNEEADGDRVTVDGGTFAVVQVYDNAGKLVESESPEAAAGFRQRVTQSEFDRALMCCWGVDQTENGKFCASTSFGACNTSNRCYSQYFAGVGSDEKGAYLPCSSVGGF